MPKSRNLTRLRIIISLVANDEHVKILKKGVKAWNKWREENPNVRPDLTGADLADAHLSGADFIEVDFSGANLRAADLTGDDLRGANLSRTDLVWADLSGADVSGANLSGADVTSTSLHHARFDATIISRTQICLAKGLDTVIHRGPSFLDVTTVRWQEVPLPEIFLRGVGLSPELNEAPKVAKAKVEYFSCFMSYDSTDEPFAERLHGDFQAIGIQCWKWDHKVKTGEKIWTGIDHAIRTHDKLVVVLSEASLKNKNVLKEVREARDEEAKRGPEKLVIFPVAIDDCWKTWDGEFKEYFKERRIADAKGWGRDPELYKRIVSRLIEDLRKA